MDHLNFFAPFESRKESHEDVLTRNFLILVKNIPLLQVAFFEMIRDNLANKGIKIESVSQGELSISDVYTQVDDSNCIFDRVNGGKLISVYISDEKYLPNHKVVKGERAARYDGVFLCEPSTVFIIENKPRVGNAWEGQLDPNMEKLTDVEVIPQYCSLSWRDIINAINNFNAIGVLSPLERTLINDFTDYVDKNYSYLNPYDRFDLCKSNKYLLDHRCIQIMQDYPDDGVVRYHKGWKHYVYGCYIIPEIALDSAVQDGNWEINLWMYAGDIMNSSREAYRKVNREELLKLKEIDQRYSFAPNLHFSTQQTGKVWCNSTLSFDKYLEYWQDQQKKGKINQIKRTEFESYPNELLQKGLMTQSDIEEFKDKITSKNYQKVNLCPGFLIKYTWEKDEAIELDKKGAFGNSFREVIKKTLAVFE